MKKTALLLTILFFCSSFIFAKGAEKSNIEQINNEESDDKKIEENLSEERQILDELFSQKQEILSIEQNIDFLKEKIEKAEEERELLEREIKQIREDFEKGKGVLSDVLRGFQKRGGANSFQLFLNAKSVSDLLFRINVFREFSKNTENMISDLKEKEEEISEKKHEIEEILNNINEEKANLEEKRKNLAAAILENEKKLASLKDDREKYEKRLKELEKRLNELDGTLDLFTKEFNDLLKNGYFPDEMINIKISWKGVSGTLKDKDLNELLKSFEVPEVEIFFEKDSVKIVSSEYKLELEGGFELVDGTKLRFKGESGSFYGLNLTEHTISDLYDKEYLLLDFKPLMGDYEIRKVEFSEGELKIYMKVF